MYLTVPTAVSTASVFSIGLECATGTCSHSHSYSRSRRSATQIFHYFPVEPMYSGPLLASLFACNNSLPPHPNRNIVSVMSLNDCIHVFIAGAIKYCRISVNSRSNRSNWPNYIINWRMFEKLYFSEIISDVANNTFNSKNYLNGLLFLGT